MLYQRILTAIPLAAFVFWIIFFQPTSVFFYFVLFIVLIAGYEWAKLSAVKNIYIRSVYATVITASVWFIYQYASDYIQWPVFIAVMWWFSITFYLKFAKPKAANSVLKPDKLFVAFIVIPAAGLAMLKIHSLHINLDWQGPAWLFYALSLVWVADIGAYFSGKKFGKNKLGRGKVFWTYLAGYSTIRFFLEFLRIKPWEISGVNVAQSFALVLITIALLFALRTKSRVS